MTRERFSRYEETPFGDWVRQNPKIESHQAGLAVSDNDWIFHKYRTDVDAMGTRDIQLMMFLELKCRNAEPSSSQCETLWFLHQFFRPDNELGRKMLRPGRAPIMVWHFGVYILSLPDTKPDETQLCRWGAFTPEGKIYWRSIYQSKLAPILGFYIRPDTLESLEFRRHHKTTDIVVSQQQPLGFAVDTIIIRRS